MRIRQMRRSPGVAINRAPGPIRENACATGVIEVDMGRKDPCELIEAESQPLDSSNELFRATGRTGIEEHESAVHGCQK